MGLSTRLAALGRRFDALALQPYEPDAPDPPATPVAAGEWPALRDWCLAQPARRFAVGVPDWRHPARARALAESNARERAALWALQLDGTDALLACRSGSARLALRARVKLQDWAGAGSAAAALPASRIWDSGRARGDVAALARFQPRRPSFIVVDSGSGAAWAPALTALQQRSTGWAHPVRLLWLLPDSVPPAADSLALDWPTGPPGSDRVRLGPTGPD